MKIQCDVPVAEPGADMLPRDPEYREYLRGLATDEMTKKAAERRRKLAEVPRLIEVEYRPVFNCVMMRFEANTISE